MTTRIPAELIERLRAAQRVTALTGAGVSAESGVPTFRDAQTGLWAQFRPEELATPQAFAANPRRVWGWYAWRRELVRKARPNPGHKALAELETHLTARGRAFTLITQNVDGLHQQAGSRKVIELHGNLQRTKCSQCEEIIAQWEESETPPPRCPLCGGLLRPDVVWFGEALPAAALQAATTAAQHCDLMLVVGTSAVVQPAASLPLLAVEAGATLVEINPQDTPLTPWVDYALRGTAATLLPSLIATIQPLNR
ncbi:MAG: NAD-dependent deacylase [Anaerolineae bacterium]|nr:MAG: NAD-dependent deacylase [Anaerolineae bacterium]